jgi:hypothetical protein
MSLFIPPRVSRELQEESRRREMEAARAMVGDDRLAWKKEFDAQLERIVHGMRLAFCPDPAPLDAVAQGAYPGRWHLVWPGYNGGPLVLQPLVVDHATGEPSVGGDGAFVEPGSWVFDRLAEMDLWSDRVQRERRRIRREAEEAKRRREERERADAVDDILERYKAVTRAQVSMNRDTPWSQNHAGRRGAKGGGDGTPDAG